MPRKVNKPTPPLSEEEGEAQSESFEESGDDFVPSKADYARLCSRSATKTLPGRANPVNICPKL